MAKTELNGTKIANKALFAAKVPSVRLYTQKRARDRSHKIFAVLTERQADTLVAELNKLLPESANIRKIKSGYTNNLYHGVRFEVPLED